MIHVIEPLGIVTEFSIGLAGFTGIIAIFANTQHGISSAIQFRITNLLVSAFAPGFCALAVISLIHLGLSDATSVRLGSAILAVVITVGLIAGLRARQRLPDVDRQQLSVFIMWLIMFVSTTNCLAQITNVVLNFENGAGVLIAGLSLQLMVGAITFAALVIQFLKGSHVS